MITNSMPHPDRARLAWFAVSRAVRVFIVGFIGWLWFSPAVDPARRPVALVVVTALAALVGIAWYVSRARAERRWRAAMERYADQELAKERFSQRSKQR